MSDKADTIKLLHECQFRQPVVATELDSLLLKGNIIYLLYSRRHITWDT